MADGPIPIFPLDAVLVPGLVMPLHIFEPRYRRLIADLQSLPEEDRAFGIVSVRDARVADALGSGSTRDWSTALYDVGTMASLREVDPLEDGRFDIVTVGTKRFRIRDVDQDAPYLRAIVDEVPEVAGDQSEQWAAKVVESFLQYRRLFDEDDETELPDEPGVLSYLVAAAVVGDLAERQGFLAAPDDGDRLRQEWAFLRRESAIISALPSLPAVELSREPYSPN